MSKTYNWFDENIGWDGLGLIALSFMILSIIIFGIVSTVSSVSKDNEYVNYAMSRIGDRNLIGKDTLMIIQFDRINNVYLLNNGMWVSPEIIYKSKKVK